MKPEKQLCSACKNEKVCTIVEGEAYCEECLIKHQMNHDSTSDVIGFSSDWFEDNDIFDEFPGT